MTTFPCENIALQRRIISDGNATVTGQKGVTKKGPRGGGNSPAAAA